MKKIIAVFLSLIACIFVISVFLAFNSSYFSEYIKVNNFDKNPVISFIKKDIISKNWTQIVTVQKNLSTKIAKNLKQTKSGNCLLFFLTSIGLAFIYGVVHSIGPGHGKFIIVSYFLSEKSKFWEAPLMAAQIAAVHIISAISVIFLLNVSMRNVLTDSIEKVFWIKIISYSLIILVGLILLFKKIFEKQIKEKVENLNQKMLAVAAGMIPCTGALLILLFSMANDALIMGIFLVIAVGIGIASTLTAIGFATIASKTILTQETIFTRGKNISTTLEYLGAFAIISLGIVMLTITVIG